MSAHHVLGEFEFNGMIFGGAVTTESLVRLGRMKLTSQDVLIAAYPKSGQINKNLQVYLHSLLT